MKKCFSAKLPSQNIKPYPARQNILFKYCYFPMACVYIINKAVTSEMRYQHGFP
jgi:hypothetical protein